MEGDEIGIVLCKVSELRSKVNNCMNKTTQTVEDYDSIRSGEEEEDDDDMDNNLLGVSVALESLEQQLSVLQALQQQYLYERESTLAEIDHSRLILLKRLKGYKGENLEVIHEVITFASGTVEQDDDLHLPPYAIHLPISLAFENGYISATHKRNTNNQFALNPTESATQDSVENKKTRVNGIRLVVNFMTKTVIIFVGVISVLNASGFRLRFTQTQYKLQDVFQNFGSKGSFLCPPRKPLSANKHGKYQYTVKERVLVPFEPTIGSKPSVNYGWG